MKRFSKTSNGILSHDTITTYLKQYLSRAPNTFNAELRSLKRLGKFLECENLFKNFKYNSVDIVPEYTPTNEEIRAGLETLTDSLHRAVYLFLASTGLRKGELENLIKNDIDWSTHLVKPNHFTRTKRSGLTFFNDEAKIALERYLSERNDNDDRLFLISDRQWRNMLNTIEKGTGVRITAKSLRRWQSVELGERGVGDRYIDIFQGRAPRSTLAKHYTSHGIERLKVVYDNAELSIRR